MTRRGTDTDGELRAVLRVDDQQRGRVPSACVKTGRLTDRAVHVRACDLGPSTPRWEELVGGGGTRLVASIRRRRSVALVLPVHGDAWKRWRTRLARAVIVLAFALGVLGIGVARQESGMLVLSAIVGAIGWRMRTRAWRGLWVGLTLRADAGEIVVSRVHPAFAEQAKQLYLDAVWRGPSPR